MLLYAFILYIRLLYVNAILCEGFACVLQVSLNIRKNISEKPAMDESASISFHNVNQPDMESAQLSNIIGF